MEIPNRGHLTGGKFKFNCFIRLSSFRGFHVNSREEIFGTASNSSSKVHCNTII